MTWKTSEKRMKQKQKNTMEGHSTRLEQAEDRISELEEKWKLKEKLKNYWTKNSRPVKGICKTSPTTSKDQT
jgi:hypothetical protein